MDLGVLSTGVNLNLPTISFIKPRASALISPLLNFFTFQMGTVLLSSKIRDKCIPSHIIVKE